MSKLDRHTVLIDDDIAAFVRPIRSRQPTSEETPGTLPAEKNGTLHQTHKAQGTRAKIPIKRTITDTRAPVLVPVLAGSPWKHYTERYFVKYWCLFAISTSKKGDESLHMIRSAPALNDEKLQIIRQICHPNIVEINEIYSQDDGNHYFVSNMMETSLLHLCRAPEYPSEPQLSSILFQVEVIASN